VKVLSDALMNGTTRNLAKGGTGQEPVLAVEGWGWQARQEAEPSSVNNLSVIRHHVPHALRGHKRRHGQR